MADRTLSALMAAQGVSSPAGKKASQQVAGAVPGARASDYFLHGWTNWQSSDYTPDVVPSGTEFHFTFNLDAGSRFGTILRPATELSAWVTTTEESDGAIEAEIVSASLTTAPPGSGSCTVAVRVGAYVPPTAAPQVKSNGFKNQPAGWVPPDSAAYTYAIVLGWPPVPVVNPEDETIEEGVVTVVYPPDPGNWNDDIGHSFPVSIRRTLGGPTTSVEWYGDHLWTNLLQQGGLSYEFPVGQGVSAGDGTVYVRWKSSPGAQWSSMSIQWDDPRFT